SRATSALVLTASLLASSVAAVGQQTATTQSTEQAQKTSQTQTQTETKQAADPKTEQKAQPATTTAKSNKPLSTNENPDMIGKRNINTGIIAKMSGSTEKEVRQGREAAAEVDRQAKFVD